MSTGISDGREFRKAPNLTGRYKFHHLLTWTRPSQPKVGSRGLEIGFARILLCRS